VAFEIDVLLISTSNYFMWLLHCHIMNVLLTYIWFALLET